MRRVSMALTITAALALGGCSRMQLDQMQTRVLAGAAAGAAAGAGVTALTGGSDYGTGTLIGAGVGAAGGFLYHYLKQ